MPCGRSSVTAPPASRAGTCGRTSPPENAGQYRRCARSTSAHWPKHVGRKGTNAEKPIGGSGGGDVVCHRGRRRARVTVLAHPGQVHLDGTTHQRLGILERFCGSDATRKIGYIGAVAGCRLFVNHNVSHFARPACTSMLRNVFGARSSAGCPATVTRPFLTGCLCCLWLPTVLCKRHPSCSIRLMISRIFMWG